MLLWQENTTAHAKECSGLQMLSFFSFILLAAVQSDCLEGKNISMLNVYAVRTAIILKTSKRAKYFQLLIDTAMNVTTVKSTLGMEKARARNLPFGKLEFNNRRNCSSHKNQLVQSKGRRKEPDETETN